MTPSATAAPSTAAPSTTAPSSSPAGQPTAPDETVPPFPDDTTQQLRRTRGSGDLVFTDIRVVERQRFDRVVMEFRGDETPGWQVRYVAKAVLDPSAREIDLGGDTVLSIFASGTSAPAPGYYDGPVRFSPEAGGDVVDVRVQGTFEGFTGALVGLDGERRPFRVLTRSAPARLLVDVQRGR